MFECVEYYVRGVINKFVITLGSSRKPKLIFIFPVNLILLRMNARKFVLIRPKLPPKFDFKVSTLKTAKYAHDVIILLIF